MAFEFKSGSRLRESDFDGLELFAEDYPEADRFLVYGGNESKIHRGIQIVPAIEFFKTANAVLAR